MPKDTFVRYGKERIPFRVPDDAVVLRAKEVPPIDEPIAAVEAALKNPIGSLPLEELLRRKQPRDAVITISDITRPVPNDLMLPPILDVLHKFGLTRDQITILIATGMHRTSSDAEKIELLGENIAKNYQVVDHRSEIREELVELPRPTVMGTRAFINRRYAEAEFKIVTGFIEPHFMAGFSGGRKGVCPGLVNVETVQKFHGFEFLNSPLATNFSLEGNPLHEEAMDVAKMVGIDFLVNVALNEDKKIAAVFAGDWDEAWRAGTEVVKDWTGAHTDRLFDVVVVCAGGYPLDKTLYQTGKGMCSALPIVKEGGIVICASECSEGLGSPSFSNIMRTWGNDWRGYLSHLRRSDTTIHDQWGFQMHIKVLQKVGDSSRLRLLCTGIPQDELSRMSVHPISIKDGDLSLSLQKEVDRYEEMSMAVIPDGPYTVAVYRGAEVARV